jgi:hypothetical protein
VLGL